MWVGVTPRFNSFLRNVTPNELEREIVTKRATGVIKSLNRSYFDDSDKVGQEIIVGSWGKNTVSSPSSDVDIYYLPPPSEFERFQDYDGNGQSAFLQDMKKRLLVTYPQTDMSGDGQVVVVKFNSLFVEVAPAFLHSDGHILIPNTNNGGFWQKASPASENETLNASDRGNNNNCRKLLILAKAWLTFCNVPLKSFYLELLVPSFLASSEYSQNTTYYYDWLLRDLFEYIVSMANKTVLVPGTYEAINIGDAWLSKANTAFNNAKTACDYERADMIINAGVYWQKIFGTKVPASL